MMRTGMLRLLIGAVGGYSAMRWLGMFVEPISAAIGTFTIYFIGRRSISGS